MTMIACNKKVFEARCPQAIIMAIDSLALIRAAQAFTCVATLVAVMVGKLP